MLSFPSNNTLIAAASRIPMLILENKSVMELWAELFLAPAMSGAAHGKESFVLVRVLQDAVDFSWREVG